MIFLDNEEGDLGRRGPQRGDWREEVACEVEWLFGRVGRCCCSFAFFLWERNLLSLSLTQDGSLSAP